LSRRTKQLARLAVIEAELRARLVEELQSVARGGNTLFFNTVEFNPCELPAHRLPKQTAELSELAAEALALRAALNEPTERSIGQIFRRALQDAANMNEHQRLGPIRQAEAVLSELLVCKPI
jgi:hypothetical protein